MRRRDFITLIGGALACPFASHAQEALMPVIGFLHSGSPDQNVDRLATFHKGLSDAGFVEGQNVKIEFRWASGQIDRLPALASDLVQRHVSVIVTPFSTDAALAAKAATTTIPIVFASSADPIDIGLVPSLNHPGGNVTGVASLNTELAPKRLDLLRRLVPQATRYFVLVNPTSNLSAPVQIALEAAASILGIHLEILRASSDSELEIAFTSIPRQSHSVLVSSTDPFFFTRRRQIATLAARSAVPTIFDAQDYVDAGGLISYGGDTNDLLLLTTSYISRVLKGERPENLPVVQSAKFNMAINLKAAKALAIDVPADLLAIADKVIE
jgi:putative tryptophan/tyrosine transport system substrate-binding protein